MNQFHEWNDLAYREVENADVWDDCLLHLVITGPQGLDGFDGPIGGVIGLKEERNINAWNASKLLEDFSLFFDMI